MKKQFLFLLFLVSLLRGANLSAQQPLTLNISYVVTDSLSFCYPLYRVSLTATGGVQPYVFRLDSFNVSSTGVFENIGGGPSHNYTVTDSLNNRVSKVFQLPKFWGGLRTSLGNWNNAASTADVNISITGRQPLQYKLNQGVFQYENIFRNVPFGTHVLTIRDAMGCEMVSNVYVYPVCNPQYTWSYTAQCSQTGDFVVFSPILGYDFKLNGISPNSDSAGIKFTWNNISKGLKLLSISSTNCTARTDSLQLGPLNNGNLYAYADFLPNRCGDSIGTAKVFLYSYNATLARPLSMSFDGRPFSSDTVFTNVQVNRSYPIKVKLADNCSELMTNVYITQRQQLTDFYHSFSIENCATRTGQLFINPIGGHGIYSFFLDGQLQGTGDSSILLSSIALGTHIIKIRSAEGCEFSKTVVLNNSDFLNSLGIYYSATCGQAAPLRLNLYNRSTNRSKIYQFANFPPQRDSVWQLTWQNVMAGNYPIRVTDSLGCVFLSDTIKLYATAGNFNATWSHTSTSCVDTNYIITPIGGQPPYTYIFDNGVPTSNNQFSISGNQRKYVSITDANNCRVYKSLFATNDTVKVISRFTGSCNNNSVTLFLSIIDTNAARPLSISYNGQPFTSDTVFTNIPKNYSFYIIVKSKQGCDLVRWLYSGSPTNSNIALTAVMSPDTCSNRLGRGGLRPYIYGGTPPYTYKWSTGQTTATLSDVPIGTYQLTVTDATGCSSFNSSKISSCVWSGDTDTSGIVDNRDVLNIGLAFGETGLRRCYDSLPNSPICTNWFAQKAADWPKQTPDKTNYKHIDTNGDGIINNSDTLAIVRNWNLVHQSIEPQTPVYAAQSVVPPIYVQTSNVREGDWSSFPIMLGETGTQAENVYGLAFSIKYPPSVIEPNTMRLVVGQSWLGASSSLLSISKDEFDNVFHIGLVKTNKQNTTGAGQIATLVFKLKAGTKGTDLQFGVYNDYLINNAGQQLTSIGRVTKVTVLTETAEPIWANQISVYPNPTTDKVYIDAQNIDIQKIILFDIAGKMIQTVPKNTPLSILTAGTYFLKIETDKGIVMKKVVKM